LVVFSKYDNATHYIRDALHWLPLSLSLIALNYGPRSDGAI